MPREQEGYKKQDSGGAFEGVAERRIRNHRLKRRVRGKPGCKGRDMCGKRRGGERFQVGFGPGEGLEDVGLAPVDGRRAAERQAEGEIGEDCKSRGGDEKVDEAVRRRQHFDEGLLD